MDLNDIILNMPFCPQCHDEFQDWVKVCPDCNVDLVDQPPPQDSTMSSPLRLVTVADFYFAPVAYLSQAKLESEGITSFVFDEYIINANWLYLIAIGGVKLKVGEADAQEAIRILEEVRDSIPGIAEQPDEGCPQCRSLSIRYETFHLRRSYILMAISALFGPEFALFFPFFKQKWKCNKCSYEWKDK
jgi:hypothetical protein